MEEVERGYDVGYERLSSGCDTLLHSLKSSEHSCQHSRTEEEGLTRLHPKLRSHCQLTCGVGGSLFFVGKGSRWAVFAPVDGPKPMHRKAAIPGLWVTQRKQNKRMRTGRREAGLGSEEVRWDWVAYNQIIWHMCMKLSKKK